MQNNKRPNTSNNTITSSATGKDSQNSKLLKKFCTGVVAFLLFCSIFVSFDTLRLASGDKTLMETPMSGALSFADLKGQTTSATTAKKEKANVIKKENGVTLISEANATSVNYIRTHTHRYETEWPIPLHCNFERPPNGTENDIEIALFYHVGMVGNWKSIVMDQLHSLEFCGLGSMASSLTISYSQAPQSGLSDLKEILKYFHFTATLTLSFMEATKGPWEQEAMLAMWSYCNATHLSVPGLVVGTEEEKYEVDKKKFVYYFHTKGVSRWEKNFSRNQTDCRLKSYCFSLNWRKYMEWFLLENPTLCLRAMLYHEASTCGINLWYSEAHQHYSGTFFATSCDYVSTLSPTVDQSFNGAEFWIGRRMSKNSTKFVSFIQLWDPPVLQRRWPIGTSTDKQGPPFTEIKFEYLDPGKYSEIWMDYNASLE